MVERANSDPSPVHLVLFVHGLWGDRRHLSSLKTALESDISSRTVHSTSSTTKIPRLATFIALGTEFNLTYDGIDICASRVLLDLDTEISRINDDPNTNERVTHLSVLGYSLGGLIARFLLGLLETRRPSFWDDVTPVNMSFYASPFVGIISDEHWFSRLVKSVGTVALSRTGKQLYWQDGFGFSDSVVAGAEEGKEGGEGEKLPLIYLMAHPKSSFYKGLKRFERIEIWGNSVNDRTVPFMTAMCEPVDPFRLLRWKKEKEKEKELDVQVNPDCVALISSLSPLSSTDPSTPSPAPSPQSLPPPPPNPRRKRRVPFLLNPKNYPVPFPFSYLLLLTLPLSLPAFITYRVIKLYADGRVSRQRIAAMRKERGETRDDVWGRVGLVKGRLVDEALLGGGQEAAVKGLEDVEAERPGEEEGRRGQATVGTGTGMGGDTDSSDFSATGRNRQGRKLLKPTSGLASSSPSLYEPAFASYLSHRASKLSKSSKSNTKSDIPFESPHGDALVHPNITPMQLEAMRNLNSLPQLEKYVAFLPDALNAHGAIIVRTPTIPEHQDGKPLLEGWAGNWKLY